jgi:hypothetical protein
MVTNVQLDALLDGTIAILRGRTASGQTWTRWTSPAGMPRATVSYFTSDDVNADALRHLEKCNAPTRPQN